VTPRLLLNRRCGPLTGATTAQIQALPLQQLEVLAVGEAFSAGLALLLVTGIRQFRRMEKRFANVI
jgi:hypothetical protein